MTEDIMKLREPLEQSSDAEVLREMIGCAAGRLMELEVHGLTGGECGERSADRITHGYRGRCWKTRAGTVELRTPRLSHRTGSQLPRLLGAPADGGEGADGGGSDGLYPEGVDPVGG